MIVKYVKKWEECKWSDNYVVFLYPTRFFEAKKLLESLTSRMFAGRKFYTNLSTFILYMYVKVVNTTPDFDIGKLILFCVLFIKE